MNPTTTALLQSALKILGTWVVAHAVMSQQDADQAITALQAVVGAVITLAGVTWHWRTAGGKGPPPAATGLIVILLIPPPTTHTCNLHWTAATGGVKCP